MDSNVLAQGILLEVANIGGAQIMGSFIPFSTSIGRTRICLRLSLQRSTILLVECLVLPRKYSILSLHPSMALLLATILIIVHQMVDRILQAYYIGVFLIFENGWLAASEMGRLKATGFW